MIITSLKIKSNEGYRKLKFSKKTILYSKDNSVGKSTILRILFYGMGYPIPGTYKLRFRNLKIWISFKRNKKSYTIYRFRNYIELQEDDTPIMITSVSDNMDSWFATIWGISSPEVLNNLLGAIYLEQDKGWTLLNRGKVIGDIRFNIRDLLIGLSTNDTYILGLIERQKKQLDILNQVKQIINIGKISAKYSETKINEDLNKVDELESLNNLKVKRKVIKRKIEKIDSIIRKDNNLKDYIYGLNLMIENPLNPNHPIIVGKDDYKLLNFDDNKEYLKIARFSLEVELNNINKEIANLNNKIDDSVSRLFVDENIIEETLGAFSKININSSIFEAKQNELEKNKKQLNDQIDIEFNKNKEIIEETQKWINKFAKILGVLDIVKTNSAYLFTHDLKSISGTQYYKVVISFKLAYVKIIESYTHITLPIILDSPSGREVTKENIKLFINILNKYFVNNQIIIASINKYSLQNAEYVNIGKRIFPIKKEKIDFLEVDQESKNYINRDLNN